MMQSGNRFLEPTIQLTTTEAFKFTMLTMVSRFINRTLLSKKNVDETIYTQATQSISAMLFHLLRAMKTL